MRPVALGHHRFKWLYVTGVSDQRRDLLVHSNCVSKPFFEKLLALFAREAGAGQSRIIILVIDGAGWHTAPNLTVPEGLHLVYLPPYTPQLQPAECLWPVLDEPGKQTLRDHRGTRRRRRPALPHSRCELFKGRIDFHWWPKTIYPNWPDRGVRGHGVQVH